MTDLNRIVFATDFSKESRKAVNTIKKLCNGKTELTLLHVINNNGFTNPGLNSNEKDKEHNAKMKKLDELKTKLKNELHCECHTKLLEGETQTEIVNYAHKTKADLLVMGHREYSLSERLLFDARSTERDILKESSCPVLLC